MVSPIPTYPSSGILWMTLVSAFIVLVNIGLHFIIWGICVSTYRMWYVGSSAKPRGRYQPFGENPSIGYMAGNWPWSYPLRPEADPTFPAVTASQNIYSSPFQSQTRTQF